jgi:hypothetical protein
VPSDGFDRAVCRIVGHNHEYTDEYENENGHVQADKVCTRCGDRELAWTGPKADRIRDLGFEVPTEVLEP